MNKSQLQPGMIVAVKVGRYDVVKAVVLEVGGWRYKYAIYPYHRDIHYHGHAIARISTDNRCIPDVVQSAAIIDTWENHEAAEAQKRERDAKAHAARTQRYAEIAQEIKAIGAALKPLGISAFARSDTGEFHLSLSDMKKLADALGESVAQRQCADRPFQKTVSRLSC